MRERILTVARDVALRARLARALKDAGYGVELAESAEHARRIGLKEVALAVVAADGLGADATGLTAELEAKGTKTLLIATRGAAPEPGTLDPSDEAGLLARIAAALRPLTEAKAAPEPVLGFGVYRLDLAGHALTDETGSEVPLTRGEFSLLREFAQRPGRVLSRDQLLNALAGRDAESYDRSIDMLVVRLRRKIEPDPKRPSLIVTIPGSGYKFTARVTTEDATVAPAGAIGEAPASASPPIATSAPERRQLTILQAALSGPAFVAARGDPEDLQRLVAALHERCTTIITPAGGTVDRLLSDGVLAYFGYPKADEHQAERAVRAALQLIGTAGQIDTGELGRLQVRLGVATGLAVVGGQPTALGEAANLAAALVLNAKPNTVLISASTRRLVGGLFESRAYESIVADGAEQPLEAWQVTAEAAAGSRFEALRGGALAPLVGRQEELELLLRRWEQAKAGNGKTVLLTGEPGIGKSRLIRAFQDAITGHSHTELHLFCSPHHQDSALHPFVAHLEHAAGITRDDTDAAKFTKLEAVLARSNAANDSVALIAELLAIPANQRGRVQQLSPQARREATLAALLAYLSGLAVRQPLLVIHEDAHWIDPTSGELLDRAGAALESSRALSLVTARPEFRPPWLEQPHVTRISLNRLNSHDAALLIAGVTGGTTIEDSTLKAIMDRAEGVPLFVEELTKAVLEDGTTKGGGAAPHAPPIPTSLNDSLLARLDRLGSGRELAQIGAVIGREFTRELLSDVAGQPAAALDPALSQLVRSELVFCTGAPADARYTFKHVLVQQAAYGSLLRGRRRELHARVAKALIERIPDELERQPQLFLHHATLAEDHELAVRACIAGGERSLRLSANEEATRLAERGLGHLDRLAQNEQKVRFLIKLLALKVYATFKHGPEVLELMDRLQTAADTAKDLGLHSEAADALLAKGCLHQWTNDPKGASLTSLRAAEVSRTADAVTRSHHLATTGRCLLEVEQQIPRALALIEEAEATAAPLGSEFVELEWAHAHAARWAGDLERAHARMRRAVELAGLREERWREIECLIGLVMIEMERRRFTTAIQYLRRN